MQTLTARGPHTDSIWKMDVTLRKTGSIHVSQLIGHDIPKFSCRSDHTEKCTSTEINGCGKFSVLGSLCINPISTNAMTCISEPYSVSKGTGKVVKETSHDKRTKPPKPTDSLQERVIETQARQMDLLLFSFEILVLFQKR